MSYRRLILSLGLVLLASLNLRGAEKPLHSLETTDDAKLTWGSDFQAKRLSINASPKYTSEGRGSLRLAGRTEKPKNGNYYLGFTIPIHPTDLREQAVAFDMWSTTPEDLKAVYFRWYDEKGQVVGSWSAWGSPLRSGERTTLTVAPGENGMHLNWEADRVKGDPSRVTRLEWLIGTDQPLTTLEAYVDNVRLSEMSMVALEKLKEPKKLYLDTPLSPEGGDSARIVAPESLADLAQKVQEAAKKQFNVQLPIVTPADLPQEQWGQQALIVLGSNSNNPVVATLYHHYYTPVDSEFPGEGGFVLESIHDPWGTGKNVILLGASDQEGLTRAVDAWARALSKQGKEAVLPPLFEIELSPKQLKKNTWVKKQQPESYPAEQVKAAKEALESGAHTGAFNAIARIGFNYMVTRDPQYALAYRDVVKVAYEHYLTNPKTFGGPWGMDSDFTIYRVMPGWDNVEESPALSDEDRLEVTKILARWVREVGQSSAAPAVGSEHVRHNHQTFPALGLYYSGRYFKHGYEAPIADYWLNMAKACFDFQMQCFKSHEDCNGYQWLTLGHTMRYSLASGNMLWFENGNAAREADYALITMDNIAYQVPYGDTGSFQCWWSEIPVLQQAAWGYLHGSNPDPERAATYQWAVNRKRQTRGGVGMYESSLDGPTKEPAALTGVVTFPVDPTYFKNNHGPDTSVPLERAVDKVVMRQDFDPNHQYMLLDGLSNGGHGHYDGNSISRITDRNRIWLADNDYYLAQPKFHNGVLVFKDGQSQKLPGFAELQSRADLPQFGYSATTIHDYAGVDWERNILWNKGRFFLVVDAMKADEANSYSFRTVWQLVGEPTQLDRGMAVDQEGEKFFVRTIDGFRQRHEANTHLGKNWSGYEHAKPVVHFYNQVINDDLEVGEHLLIPNLLYTVREDVPADLDIKQVQDGVYVISGMESPIVAGVAPSGRPVRVETSAGVLETDGRAFMIDHQRLSVADATFVQLADQRVEFEKPTSIELPFGEESATVSTEEPDSHSDQQILALRAKQEQRSVNTLKAGKLLEAIAALPAKGLETSGQADGQKLAALSVAWEQQDKLKNYLLTGNTGQTGSVDMGMQIDSSPAPMASNVFAAGPNTTASLMDGVLDTVQGCTQWDTDQVVTLTMDFGMPVSINRVAWDQWYVSSSSKNKQYMLDNVQFQLSNDGFKKDIRNAGVYRDTAKHGNWGAPDHAPIHYEHTIQDKARQLRMIITPKAGTGVYLAELKVWGKPTDQEMMRELVDQLPRPTVKAIATGDLNGDGVAEVVVGNAKGEVAVSDLAGKSLWKKQFKDAVNVVMVEDLDADGQPEIVCGGDDATLRCLNAQGELVWEQAIPSYKNKAKIHVLFPAQLQPGKQKQVVAGADNWRYYAYDANGKELWWYESVHRSTAGTAADLNGDGLDEVICGTEYYWWPVVDAKGERLWQFRATAGPGVNAVAVAKRTEGPTVFFGGQAGTVAVADATGDTVGDYNTGDEITALKTVTLDGQSRVFGASMNYDVFAMDAEGNRIWRTDVGTPVMDLAVIASEQPRLMAGDSDGTVYLLDTNGKLLGRQQLQGAITDLTPVQRNGQWLCIVGTDSGELVALEIE